MNRRKALALLSIVAVLGFACCSAKAQVPPAPAASAAAPAANQDLEQRVRELESLVRSLQAQVATQPTNFSTQSAGASLQPPVNVAPSGFPSELPVIAAPDGPKTAGLGYTGSIPSSDPQEKVSIGLPKGEVAGWNNGFYIQSPNRDFILRFTGQIQTDYRGFMKSADTTDIDTFLLRRARFGLEATVFDYYEFRFLPDFAQGKTVIQDCYMNVRYCEDIQFEVGKFKEPVSYEQLIQDRYVPSMERSLIDQMMPQRDIGVMLHGENLLNKRFDWAVGLFNGEINGDTDTNNCLDVAWRGVVRPFNCDEMPIWLRYVQVGMSGTAGRETEPMSPSTLKTPATVPWLTFTSGDKATGMRTRYVPEYSYFCGPFGFFAEYLVEDQEITGANAKAKVVDFPFDGFVVFGSLLLTGETRTSYNEQIKPLAPFDPRCPFKNPGAWEVIARVSQLRIAPGALQAGSTNQLVDPTKYSNQATEFTFGFNWYWNAWVRTQFNVEHAQFNDPVLLGATPPTGRLTGQDTIYTRFQIIF